MIANNCEATVRKKGIEYMVKFNLFASVVIISFHSFTFALADESDQEPSIGCKAPYLNLYAKDNLNISIFFGYTDDGDNGTDLVIDGQSKAAVIAELTHSCENGANGACGFQKVRGKLDLLRRTIEGPDGKDRIIDLRIMNSSVSNSDSQNKGRLQSKQLEHSAKVARLFLNALQTDDIVIYAGHSRHGTGPGFYPMAAADWIPAVLFEESLNKMTSTLKNSPSKPKVLGMFVCEGAYLYGKPLHEASPETALLLTREISTDEDDENALLSFLDSIFKKQCAKALRKGLSDATHNFICNGADCKFPLKYKTPELFGYFEKHPRYPNPTDILRQLFYQFTGPKEIETDPATRNDDKAVGAY